MGNEGQQGQTPTTSNKAEAVAEHAQAQQTPEEGAQGYAEPTEEELLALLGEDDPEETPEDEQTTQKKPEPEPEEEEPKEDPLSKKFAELAKQETKYQKQIRDLKSEIDALKEGTQDKVSKNELLEELKAEYRKNPKRFLEKQLGGSYDELSDFILNEEDRTKEIEATEKLTATEKRIAELEKKIQDKEQSEKEKAYNEKIEGFKSNIREFAKSKGEEFGLISALGEEDTVFQVMQDFYEKEGRTLEIDEACSQVESYLTELVQKVSKLDKVKKLLSVDNTNESPKTPKGSQLTPEGGETPKRESETLTSDFTSGYSESDLENMSDEELEKLALGML